jgi:hypothetical protein
VAGHVPTFPVVRRWLLSWPPLPATDDAPASSSYHSSVRTPPPPHARWNWSSEGNENATRMQACSPVATVFASLLYPDGSTMPPLPGDAGLRGAGDAHRLRGAASPATAAPRLPDVTVAVAADGAVSLTLTWGAGVTDVVTASGMVVNATLETAAGGAGEALVTLARNGGAAVPVLTGADVDLGRNQGDVGLQVSHSRHGGRWEGRGRRHSGCPPSLPCPPLRQVLDVGYTFGEAPEWVVAQRVANPTYPWPPNTRLAQLNGWA